MDPPWTRGFIVLGERIGLGWPVLAAFGLLVLLFAQAAEERREKAERAELRATAADATALAEEQLEDTLACNHVLTKCTEALGGEAACACFFPDQDGDP